MGWATSENRWSDDETDRLCALSRDGLTVNAMGAALGRTRNSVSGQINRLRLAGDERLRPAALDPIRQRAARIDRLADLMADGCETLQEASTALDIPITLARELWTRIRTRLGPQAI